MSVPLPRRRSRTIGTVFIGTCLLLMAARALTLDRGSRTFPLPAVKANISQAERTLHGGANVFAVDGTIIGTVAGMSRDGSGHVERIRVATSDPLGFGQRIVIVGHTMFAIDQRGVQLTLSVAEVNSLPRAMMEDHSAGFMSLY